MFDFSGFFKAYEVAFDNHVFMSLVWWKEWAVIGVIVSLFLFFFYEYIKGSLK